MHEVFVVNGDPIFTIIIIGKIITELLGIND